MSTPSPACSPFDELAQLLHSLRLLESARKPPPNSLTAAVLDGDIPLVRAFLDQGADLEERSIGFASPLQAVAGAGRREMVDLLLARGADPREKPECVYSPLSAAAMHGHLEIVRLLADAIGDLSGETRAVPQAASHGQTACLQLLIAKGASPGPHAGHALRVAAWGGRFACVKVLVQAGVDPSRHPDYAFDLFGEAVETPYTPSAAARENGHELVADFLLGKPVNESLAARVESRLRTPGEGLAEAAKALRALGSGKGKREAPPVTGDERRRAIERSLELIRDGAADGRVNDPARDGRPLLGLAAESGCAVLVHALLRADASPDAASAEGVTALIEAARWGHHEVVSLLLDAGANPNARTRDKETALIAAAGRGDRESVGRLLEKGADPKARMRGKSARYFACGVHKQAIRELLLAHAERREEA